MQSIFDTGAPPPCPAPFNMAAHVLAHAARLPDKVALAVLGPAKAERWSYGRLEAAVRGVASGFLQAGLTPGDRVLLRLGNQVEFPIAFLAALAVDLVPVPTSAQLTAPEITKMAADLQPALVVAGDGVALPDGDWPVITASQIRDFETLPPADYVMGPPDRPGYIVYTSGSSGVPRGVIHAHRAIWARQMMHQGWYGLREDDRLLHAGAFNWTFTLGTGLMDPWSVGATALIPGAGVAPAMLPLLLRRHDATLFAAAPGVFRQMLRGQIPAMPRLRHALSAGEKMSADLHQAWREATRLDVHEAFGMSECSTFISGCPDHPAPDGAIGYAQPGRRVAILDGDQIAPCGTPGIMAVSRRDPGLMLGYLNAEAETKARFSGEWFLTGDRMQMDETGAIQYLGREDDMMNAGGFRVSPLEVEAVLLTHPDISEVAVTEVEVRPDVRVIGAFYTGPAPLTDYALKAFAVDRLAGYKAPRLYVHCQALPRGGNGKLNRKALAQIYKDQA